MLPKENRITKKNEFDAFFGKEFKRAGGYSVSSKNFVIKSIMKKDGKSRIGFIINTKVDKRASVRNKIKRQVREVFHMNLNNLKKTVEILVVIQKGAKSLDFGQIEEEIVDLLKKMQLL
ncbi:ribonuclease P protein component [Candidatus Falkowbacteria bacterium CG10_big_fil_rev_8_21_14_0_10_39_11]|uniref:Ribonuclease P protein component n=1 Tax=Candidatus Falkowbacteria bacterium CG10_big_fil_rev_8_21_14_0_10_39_11 TaxID=1974565 RepID=A0A2H0V3X2_9BACT|nr:MAG: ribonuclease P protein component [Candidatus Falkowbacteria bacterium CG10_big_fil_rev_8_21_14_0_10_39_11]